MRNLYQTEDVLLHLKEIGAETSEIHLQTFYEYRPEFAKKYAPRLEGTEVACISVAPQNFEPQLFSENRRIRGDGLYWLDQLARSAQLFDAKNYALCGAVQNCGCNVFGEIAERLGYVAEFCSRYGLNLCLENCVVGIYSRPNLFCELKQRVQTLSGVFNLEQARKSCYPYQMYINDMSGAISCARLSDMDQNGKICLPGEGGTDFKEVLKRLKGAGFDGALIIDAPAGELAELSRSAEHIKEIVYKLS